MFLSIAISILYTVVLYGVGPLIFAKLRKSVISKKRLIVFSCAYTFCAWFCSNMFWAAYNGSPVSRGGAAWLYGTIFYWALKRHLEKTGRLYSPSATPQDLSPKQEADIGQTVVVNEPAEEASLEIATNAPAVNIPPEAAANRLSEPCNDTPEQSELPVQAESSKRRPSWPVVVLSAVCAVLSICVFLLGYSVSGSGAERQQLTEHIESLTAENADLQKQVTLLESERERLKSQITRLTDRKAQLQESISNLEAQNDELGIFLYDALFLYNNIGFLTSESDFYHSYNCSIFQNADEYWAHNVEYCEYLGYSMCPECW